MFSGLRMGLLVVAGLLLAEDFQFVLKIEEMVLAKGDPLQLDLFEDCSESDSKTDKEEEQKEEQISKNKNKDNRANDLAYAAALAARKRFHNLPALLPDISYDLESPPPEV